MENPLYKMMINNLAIEIVSDQNRKAVVEMDPKALDVFTASELLGIALAKDKEKIAMDIINQIDENQK